MSEQLISLVVLAVFILIAVGLLVALGRLRNALQEQQQSQSVIQNDLRALCNAAVQVGERVNRMEGELKTLQQRQQELGVRQDKMAQSEPHDASFEQAIRLAKKGSSVEEMMEICNISRGEAELIAMMHRLDEYGSRVK